MNINDESIIKVSIPAHDRLNKDANYSEAQKAGEESFRSNAAMEIRNKFSGVFVLREINCMSTGELILKVVGEKESKGFTDFMALVTDRKFKVESVENYEISDQDAGRRTD